VFFYITWEEKESIIYIIEAYSTFYWGFSYT